MFSPVFFIRYFGLMVSVIFFPWLTAYSLHMQVMGAALLWGAATIGALVLLFKVMFFDMW